MPVKKKKVYQNIVMRGIGVSPGVVIGKVFLVTPSMLHIQRRQLKPSQVDHEISRLEEALIQTRQQLKQLQSDIANQTGNNDNGILDAHLMVLDDRSFIEQIVKEIREKKINVEAVVEEVAAKYINVLSKVQDSYLRERISDIKDVIRRILRNLTGGSEIRLDKLPKGAVIVARDLAPSETASLRREMVGGFAIDLGSPTCHTAVLARVLEIPGIVGLRDVTTKVEDGDEVLLDGNKGIFIIRPSAVTLKEYNKVAETRKSIQRSLRGLKHQPAETIDGHKITLAANAEGLEELNSIIENGAEGIGLFRSEYLYLSRSGILSEEEQAHYYVEIAKRLSPFPVIIRTLDIGGDKFRGEEKMPAEANPFLGCRSIRLSLAHPEEFKVQLRAILRASSVGNIKVMYPMISSAVEVAKANALLEEAKKDLDREHVVYDKNIEIGVMIEIPAAALTADVIARHVKFFSIGTNDLIQYTLAVDRVNERVAYLYEPTHPAVLQLIKATVEAGHRNRIWVGLCGEMGADPLLTPLLVGLGIDELSVAPIAVPLVKDMIRHITFVQAKQLADEALQSESAGEVLELCRKLTKKVAPELLELV